VAAADDPEVYQVVLHAGAEALTGPAGPPGDPADPGRCHVEDGPAISPATAQMLACSAALSWMRHDRGGAVLDLGRRRRRPNAAIRRAARERDRCRCRFPGCESRRVDLHHVRHWINGGRTSLDNLISLCKRHHVLVHERGYLIAAARDGTFAFCRPDGTRIPACPALPEADGSIAGSHEAEIGPDTIVPTWYGERLDLDHAIYVCFANAENQSRRQSQQEQKNKQDQQEEEYEPFQPRKWIVEWSDWQFGQPRRSSVDPHHVLS
jgi:HNH endonuclease